MSTIGRIGTSEAHLQTGFVRQVGKQGDGAQELEVLLGTAVFAAVRAKGCLVTPDVGDKVLCAVDAESVYVISVLSGQPGVGTTIVTEGDLTVQSKSGQVTVGAAEGVHIAASGPVSLTGRELQVTSKKASVAVDELGFLGRLVQAEVSKVAVVANEIDSVVTRISQRAKRVFRFIEELDQTRAKTIDTRAEKALMMRAENAVISARVLTKVDGEQIHIG
ncbi:MAG: DUF3540 domain-containing protein [Polyangiaceae bacterium]|nr:DUF3540 domain-containing protein [Polyangiaceae bacterium]